jgi:hypothetical protein
LLTWSRLKKELVHIIQEEQRQHTQIYSQGIRQYILMEDDAYRSCKHCGYDCYISGTFFKLQIKDEAGEINEGVKVASRKEEGGTGEEKESKEIFLTSLQGIVCNVHPADIACLHHASELCPCDASNKRLMVRIQLPELKRMFDYLSSFIEKARLAQESQQKFKMQQQEQAKLWQQQYQAQVCWREGRAGEWREKGMERGRVCRSHSRSLS